MIENKELITIDVDGNRGSITVVISTEPTCRISFESTEFESSDLFSALALLRNKLEESGKLIACNGSRGDVFPSGMAREMSRGRKAYLLKEGVRPDREDLVDIFDCADPDEIASVEEQRNQFDRWINSFGA